MDGAARGESAASGSPSAPAGAGAAAPSLRGRVSQGVSAKEIKIGISTASDFSATAAAFGLQEDGDSNADQAKAQAVVNYINKHGGVARRKLVPVFHDISATGSFDTEAQAACAAWAEDNQVFAALAWLYDRDTLLSCLARRNTVLVKSSAQVYTNEFANRYRNFFYQPDFLFGDHWHVYIDGLVAQGFLRKSNRIGLVRLDDPEHEKTADNVLRPALARHGLKLTEEAAITPFNDAGEAVGQTNAQVSNAVLRFRDSGVDRVIYIDIGNVLMWFFGVQAESQNYRPDHGMNSLNIPSYIQDNVPAAQLEGAKGVGWWPNSDEATPSGNQSGEEQCEKILREAKLAIDGVGLSYCSRLFFLKAAMDRAIDITPAGLRAAVDGLGRSFSSAVTAMSLHRPGRFDGVGGVRYFRFDTGCACFRYTGAWRSILG